MSLEIDGRSKECTGVIAELEKMMNQNDAPSIIVIVKDVPTKIDVYAWAKRKGHTISGEKPFEGVYKVEVLR